MIAPPKINKNAAKADFRLVFFIRQLKQTVKAKADGKSKEDEIKEIPEIQVCAYFTVGFTLPLVLTNGLEVKLSGALAPLSEQIKIGNYLATR